MISHNYILFNLGFFVKISMNENLKNGKHKLMVDGLIKKIKICGLFESLKFDHFTIYSLMKSLLKDAKEDNCFVF